MSYYLTRALYWRPEIKLFKPGQENDLETYLAALDTSTSVDPVSRLADYLLTPRGVTQEGYRYTAAGFRQVCQLLAAGLNTFMDELSGSVRRPNTAPDMYDLTAAVSIFNTAVTLRFEWLREKYIVRNTKLRLLEGVVSQQYRFLPNRSLYQQSRDAGRQAPLPVEFLLAMLVGRRLALWYKTREAVFTLPTPQPEKFWTGYYFCNGEANGVSLRAAEAFFSKDGGSLGSFRDLSIAHAGQNFEARALRLFDKIMDRAPGVPAFQEGIQQLLLSPLWPREGAARPQRRNQLIQVLKSHMGSVGFAVIAEAVDNALYYGRRPATQTDTVVDPTARELASRSGYDLYCNLVRQSKRLDLNRREKLEQLANRLLLGKLKL